MIEINSEEKEEKVKVIILNQVKAATNNSKLESIIAHKD